jgi:ABC-type phosphate/phosphonate transport system substrate-binding protein
MRRAWFAVGLGLTMAASLGRGDDSAPVRIGIMPSLYRGQRPELAAAIKNPLLDEIESETGLDCELDVALTPGAMRKKLTDGQLQFGFCHGFEFAWMQAKEPKLRALMLATPSSRPITVSVVVAQTSRVKTLCDLNGKLLAIPKGIDPAVHLFAERKCRCEDKPLTQSVKEITRQDNAELALHDVFEDKVQAAIVDSAALQAFAERVPARWKKLRTLVESKPFPFSVVAYCEGSAAPALVRRFQETMTKARTNRSSRLLMALMHCDGFEPAPARYAKELAEFLKEYPQQDAEK